MNNEERGDGDIERFSKRGVDTARNRTRSKTPTRRFTDSNTPASRGDDGTTSGQTAEPDSLAAAVSGSLSWGQSVTVETESATATLVGVPRVDIQEFVFSHRAEDDTERPVALFDVENKTERPLRWQSTRTQFVGTDEYTYSPARTSLDPESLGPGCHTRQVELPPGKRARVVTLVEELPRDVEIVEVIQTLSPGVGTTGTERLVFSL